MYLFETLALDLAATWIRLFITLAVSIVFAIVVGISAAKNRTAERVLLPFLDLGQTIPILGFFPVAIYLIVSVVPGPVGINFAVIFLLFTSMAWNIAFGVYESVKAIPEDLLEATELQMLGRWRKLWTLYIPASMPRIAYQSAISWSIGLFYLVTSEIFSTGSQLFSVKYGLGVVIAQLSLNTNPYVYAEVLVMFIAAILLTRFLFLSPLREYSERFSFKEVEVVRRSRALVFYSRVHMVLRKLFPPVELPKLHIGRHRYRHAPAKPLPPAGRGGSVIVPFIIILSVLLVASYVVASGAAGEVPVVFAALAVSFLRVWGVYIVCAAIALPLGIMIAKSTRAYEPASSALQVLSAIPAPIVFPIIVVLVYRLPGGGEIAALVIIFIAEIWYVLFSVIAGMRTIPDQLLELKRMMRLKWYQAWKQIYVPAVLPAFATGSITAIGGAWNSLIIAEYFASQTSGQVITQVGTGIGKVLDIAVFAGNFPLMVLALASMTAMVVLINRVVWQRIYNRVTERYKITVQE